jgi:hypothetical protein
MAKDYIGEIKTVCGLVSSVSNIDSSKNVPIFINLGPAYPDQIFTIVIWKEWQDSLDINLRKLRNKTVCVEGMIDSYRDIPQIEINKESKIWIESDEASEPSEIVSANDSVETNKSMMLEASIPVVESKNISILVNKVSSEKKAIFSIIPSNVPKDCLFSGLLVSHQDNGRELFELPVIPMNMGFDGTALNFMVDSEGIDTLQQSNQVAVNVCGNWVKLKDEHVANIKNALN